MGSGGEEKASVSSNKFEREYARELQGEAVGYCRMDNERRLDGGQKTLIL